MTSYADTSTNSPTPFDELSLVLLENVHEGLQFPTGVVDKRMIHGGYQYYHYLCDGVNDRGWGCGYRTLQTLMSWLDRKELNKKKVKESVPTLMEIQQALVAMGDKPSSFLGSREWIGSVEISMCLDYFHHVPCKIIHVPSGARLGENVPTLKDHFRDKGSPVMMGGNTDASSKGILGVCTTAENTYLLILDPHYVGKCANSRQLQEDGWVKWRCLNEFDKNSFYNLCLPQSS